MKIWVVDAFTGQPYCGNPAAVVIVDEFPDDQMCLKMAAEINLSETAFVKQLDKNRFHLRWFTPTVEVKLCGHATLASAHILYQEKKVNENQIQFESLSGILNVYQNENDLTLDFPLQETGPDLDKTSLETTFGMPIIAAVKALDCIIIELVDEAAVQQFNFSPEKIMSVDCRGLAVTTKSHGKYDFVSRYFAPKSGINEDPVTGSAHCKLASYWQKKLSKNKFFAYQASKRGGELRLEIKGSRLFISGHAVTIFQGEWLIRN